MRKLEPSILNKVENWNNLTRKSALNENFIIHLEFKTGRSGNDILAFDSVIAHYTMLYVLQSDYFNLSYDHDELVPITIPLFKVQFKDTFFYMCSYLFDLPEKSTYWTKRFEKRLLNSVNAKRVSVQQGDFKSYLMPTLYSDRKHYKIFGEGNIELLKKIIPNPAHIGKKHSVGWGECTWEIEKQNGNSSFALMRYDKLMRPLPVDYCKQKGWFPENDFIEMRPICPPYYGINSKPVNSYPAGTKLKPLARA